ITHLSNVTGSVLPVKEITELAHSKGIAVLVDGCQGAPHLKLDMQDIDCDFYAISCHKMYGPTGLGVLYAKKKWLEELPPYQGGGGMIQDVKNLEEDEKTKLMCLSGVKQYPMRVKCATLSWHTLISAIDNTQEEINTEKLD
ncbi:aminotransferase class V-fold PLP-dependent enzyme, partial [Candidatus Pelagibacter sp.]|nr:aminotransferase class V-fold PLP-dependent enzyme [Candidatus Pelagibacter sp.]